MRLMRGFTSKTKKLYEEAAQIAAESVENMRTVASITREPTFDELYQANLEYPNRVTIRCVIFL